jgi:hypothetical protein
MKKELNENRFQFLAGVINESQINEVGNDLNVSEDTWNKWLELSNKLEYEDYDLETHNYEQINSLFRELKWIEANKDKYNSDEDLFNAFSDFIG